ncbi:PAS domain-containing sensor histidine kinase [Anabaena sp. FACHB-709]|uniref:histidine kinase n=2 Tax=Nostocaceae TaxID=1162 RepID=A0A1Z4KJN4_ANAVA|nr:MULTISPECIES: PAS domain-containing sensor histidine kinase [Nostocaceae]BAY69190.1 two-component sensor histidine kinase [Trichormus variabilis NIES-23]MBD2174913.1 PAS domain-containing sensor histidine kinase [Anabaena cylindrica FACHB-318]MBD2266737.1 PAS domain-containing sensor histidine kinase [Anabaena sp. FACHB-709]MBD2276282.1 PAS domain-containing sensor histidine kinase [Nostoc sp. PCC 7120 = FACHB-418]MBD2285984.1 PAS domain-containing sensor histidine kinase [Anabaena cylindri
MTTFLIKLQRLWRKTLSALTLDEITTVYQNRSQQQEWLVNRQRFLWQRLHLWLWLVLGCLLTFTLRNVYDLFFPLRELKALPQVLRTQGLMINAAMLLSLLVCFTLHKTRFGHRHPGILFLGSSWSLSLASQLFATLKGFALPDTLGWSLLFLSQATLMPVRWTLHLVCQLGILVYYFGVNTALRLSTPAPNHPEIYNVTFILYIFWFCIICDLGVYLYDRLQRSEFYARKELESANNKLRLAEAKYRSIFENAIEGIFQSSPDGRYITANPALARIYGYTSPEEVTENFTDIEHQLYVDPKRRAEFVRLMEESGLAPEFESQIYRQDGSVVWISEKAYAVRDEQGNLLYYEGLVEDITQRKQAQEALRVFFHAVSHDLRNPVLGTLMVLRNLLNDEAGEAGKAEEAGGELTARFSPSPQSPIPSPQSPIPVPRSILKRMVQSSDRQLNLINSLLEAHIGEVQGLSLQCQPVQLQMVVEAAIADLEPMLVDNQATLINLVTADLPLVNADPTQVWRVFSNFIVNAIKHNPPGLHLTINAIPQDDEIYCTVNDNGVGISQQQSDRLFDLYFRGGSIRNSLGLGLGLYLCKQIITAHGGEIGVKSGLEKGATFWFTLPMTSNQVNQL